MRFRRTLLWAPGVRVVCDATRWKWGFGRHLGEVVPIGTQLAAELGGVGSTLSLAPHSKELRCSTSPSSGEAHDAAEPPLLKSAT
jgi:hypothetical protein